MKRILFTLAFLACLIIPGIGSTEKIYVESEGQHVLSKQESLSQAEGYATQDALRNAIEQVGVRIDSYTEVVNHVLVEDKVTTVVSSFVQVLNKEIKPIYQDNEFIIIAKVSCVVDTDKLDNANYYIAEAKRNSLVWDDNDFNKAKKALGFVKGR